MSGELKRSDFFIDGGSELMPHAFIQWKGTDVCMDCYCECGKNFHVDATFAYAVECPACHRKYEMAHYVLMRPLPEH